MQTRKPPEPGNKAFIYNKKRGENTPENGKATGGDPAA
jgi:hypothetical protein